MQVPTLKYFENVQSSISAYSSRAYSITCLVTIGSLLTGFSAPTFICSFFPADSN